MTQTKKAPTVGAAEAKNAGVPNSHEANPCPPSIPQEAARCNENVTAVLIITERKGGFFADSRNVAEWVGKSHYHLMRDIDGYVSDLTESNFGCSTHPEIEGSAELKIEASQFFVPGTYKDASGKRNRMYWITRRGCEFTANKMTGRKGTLFTAAYITRFHQMEQLLELRHECPALTEAVAWRHENPQHYHFTNEFDLINRVALGMKAKQFKIAHGIDLSAKSIRPYLSPDETELVNLLQRVDIGLLYAGLSTQEREAILRERMAQHSYRLAAVRTAPRVLESGRCRA